MYFCCVLCVPKTTKRKNVIFIHEWVLKYLYYFFVFLKAWSKLSLKIISYTTTPPLYFFTLKTFILIMYISVLNTHISHISLKQTQARLVNLCFPLHVNVWAFALTKHSPCVPIPEAGLTWHGWSGPILYKCWI